jgi:hypothetical protein
LSLSNIVICRKLGLLLFVFGNHINFVLCDSCADPNEDATSKISGKVHAVAPPPPLIITISDSQPPHTTPQPYKDWIVQQHGCGLHNRGNGQSPIPPHSLTKFNHLLTMYSLQSFILTSTLQGIPLPIITGPGSNIATTTSDIFITPSAPQTGLPSTNPSASCSGITSMFVCMVNFLIYCPEKKVTKVKKAKVKWVAYTHQKDSAVTFNPEGIHWTSFQKFFRIESGRSFSTMPSMIEEQSKCNLPSITWRAFIFQNKKYAKGTAIAISSNYDFQKWMDCMVEKEAKRGGIILKMENLLVKEKPTHMEALLAKSICMESSWLTSQSGPAASDDVCGLASFTLCCPFPVN